MINVTKSNLPPLGEYTAHLRKIWAKRWLTNNGNLVQLLEKKLKKYLGVGHITLVSNGTLALELALKAYDLEGEVITTPFTFATTTNVILWSGLTPIFADIDRETFNIDPADVERKITPRTRAILAVHIYGNPCYAERLKKIADRHKLRLIYDAAHAFGVKYRGRTVLEYGDMSALSFHPTKVFHTIEGGAVVATKRALGEKLKLIRNHGIRSEDEVVFPGTNAKMNEFQAAMGLCNLRKTKRAVALRKKIYECYKEKLGALPVEFQKITASEYNYAYMPVCFENVRKRDEVYSKLIKKGVKARKYFYPLTINFDYFKKGRHASVSVGKGLKNASHVSDRILCLPIYPDLALGEVDRIVGEIVKIAG